MLRRILPILVLLVLIALDLAMIVTAVHRYPALLTQPGARTFVLEPVIALLAYAAVIILLSSTPSRGLHSIQKPVLLFGLLTGSLEILNIVLENSRFTLQGPAVPITFMLLTFGLWSAAGYRASRGSGSFRAGLLAAVCAAGLCMLLAVTAGLLAELFIAPPDPHTVASWAEFQRSRWTDPHAFAIANTLDSGFTHLLVAPVVALLFGGLGAGITKLVARKPLPTAG